MCVGGWRYNRGSSRISKNNYFKMVKMFAVKKKKRAGQRGDLTQVGKN